MQNPLYILDSMTNCIHIFLGLYIMYNVHNKQNTWQILLMDKFNHGQQ